MSDRSDTPEHPGYANESRDYRIFEDFALALIDTARAFYADDSIGIDLKQGLYVPTRL